MNRSKMSGNIILLTAALIWGSAFVAQSVGMDYIGPFTFNSLRSFLGGIVLLPFIYFNIQHRKKKDAKEEKKNGLSLLLIGGISCGILLTIASNLQQIGIMNTTVGKAGFLTSLYIIIVPVIWRLIGRKVSPVIWFSVAAALIGMYLLTINEKLQLGTGDLLIILCAVFFSLHILTIDHFAPKVDTVMLACIQFWVCGFLSAIPMVIYEKPNLNSVFDAWVPLLYAGILSSGVAYTFQMIGQKKTSPTAASLILSLEAVFAALTGWIVLNEVLTLKEIIGCSIIFIAIITSQLPSKIFSTKILFRKYQIKKADPTI